MNNPTGRADLIRKGARSQAGVGNSAEADELDLGDQRAVGPEEAFGPLWRKIHRIRLTGSSASPEQVITDWKAHFGEFWPGDNRFFGVITSLAPGELAVISLEMPAAVTLSSGVILAESNARGFTLITPKGHMLAGRLHFSTNAETGPTTAEVDMRIRAADPLFELGMVLFGHRRENKFWEQTLRNLADSFNVPGELETLVICEDRGYQLFQAPQHPAQRLDSQWPGSHQTPWLRWDACCIPGQTMTDAYDAVIIGAEPNGLARRNSAGFGRLQRTRARRSRHDRGRLPDCGVDPAGVSPRSLLGDPPARGGIPILPDAA